MKTTSQKRGAQTGFAGRTGSAQCFFEALRDVVSPTDAIDRRKRNREEVARLKLAHGIFTHKGGCSGVWMALSMPECAEALSGYDLTDEEKTDGVALMGGYCRLLDEAGLIEDDHKTELDAVKALVARLGQNTERSDAPRSLP